MRYRKKITSVTHMMIRCSYQDVVGRYLSDKQKTLNIILLSQCHTSYFYFNQFLLLLSNALYFPCFHWYSHFYFSTLFFRYDCVVCWFLYHWYSLHCSLFYFLHNSFVISISWSSSCFENVYNWHFLLFL